MDPGWTLPGSKIIPPGAVTVRFSGTSTLPFLRQKEIDHPQLRFNTLPRFDEVVLFE